MQKVVYISNSRDLTEQNDINENIYLKRINKLLEEGWVVSQMNTQTGKLPSQGNPCILCDSRET